VCPILAISSFVVAPALAAYVAPTCRKSCTLMSGFPTLANPCLIVLVNAPLVNRPPQVVVNTNDSGLLPVCASMCAHSISATCGGTVTSRIPELIELRRKDVHTVGGYTVLKIRRAATLVDDKIVTGKPKTDASTR
jgi:hypothetical protein